MLADIAGLPPGWQEGVKEPATSGIAACRRLHTLPPQAGLRPTQPFLGMSCLLNSLVLELNRYEMPSIGR